MLKQRVVTATTMLVCFLLALFVLPKMWFAVIAGALFLVGAWEWSNLCGIQSKISRIMYALSVSVIALIVGWYSNWSLDLSVLKFVLIIASCWWVLSLIWIRRFPGSSKVWGSRAIRMLMGGFVLVPAWLSCIFLRDSHNGAWLILMIVFIIAAADIGAYFTGKAIGKRKLAVNVSPGKSWEGVWGGLLFSLFIGFLFNLLFSADQWLVLALILIPTSLVSVVGDLLESMVKRHRGVKDSSQLLPGHGGVLDRIDGLVAAAPVFALAILLTSYQL